VEPSIIKEGEGDKKKKRRSWKQSRISEERKNCAEQKENRARKGQNHTAVNRASERFTNSLKATI